MEKHFFMLWCHYRMIRMNFLLLFYIFVISAHKNSVVCKIVFAVFVYNYRTANQK